MVKAKFVVDNREAGETEDCGLIVAIGLGEMKEENQFQLAVVGGKGLRGSMMVQGLADGIAEAISRMTDNDMQAIAMLTAVSYTHLVTDHSENSHSRWYILHEPVYHRCAG